MSCISNNARPCLRLYFVPFFNRVWHSHRKFFVSPGCPSDILATTPFDEGTRETVLRAFRPYPPFCTSEYGEFAYQKRAQVGFLCKIRPVSCLIASPRHSIPASSSRQYPPECSFLQPTHVALHDVRDNSPYPIFLLFQFILLQSLVIWGVETHNFEGSHYF